MLKHVKMTKLALSTCCLWFTKKCPLVNRKFSFVAGVNDRVLYLTLLFLLLVLLYKGDLNLYSRTIDGGVRGHDRSTEVRMVK